MIIKVNNLNTSGIYDKNIYYISNKKFTLYLLKFNDSIYIDSYQMNKFENYITKDNLELEYDYLILLTNNLTKNEYDILKKIFDDLILNNCENYYYLIYNLKSKTLMVERNSNIEIIDTYNIKDNILERIKTKYMMCLEYSFYWFEDYINSLKDKLELIYIITNDIINYNYIDDEYTIYLFYGSIDISLINKKFNKYIINVEQLTLIDNLKNMDKYIINKIPIIDYSLGNIKILKHNCIYFPYQYNENEINKLKEYYTSINKEYHVAICGTLSKRRKDIMLRLQVHGVKILYVEGWKDERDKKIASCMVLLNIHNTNDHKIYESMRCDRWIFAGMPVISENCLNEDLLDIKKYNFIQFFPYNKLVSETINFLKNPNKLNVYDINVIKNEREQILNNVIL